MHIFLFFSFAVVFSVIHGENYCDTGLRAPDNSTDPNDCCPSPLFLPADIVKECRDTYLEMQKKKNDLPGPPRGCCIGDCILDKMGFNPKGDGNIDFEGLRKSLLDQTKEDPVWTDTLSQAIYDCYAMAESRAEEFKTGYATKAVFEGEKMCHPISGRVLSCITNQKFINCPSSVWKATDDCVKIKTFVARCETPKQA